MTKEEEEEPRVRIKIDRALTNEELTEHMAALQEILLELERKLVPFGDRFVETRLKYEFGLRRLRST